MPASRRATYTCSMETERPLWRSRAWLGAAALLGLFLGVLLTVGFAGPTSRAGVSLAVGGVLAAVIVVTSLRVRGQRRRYEAELADWATERAAAAERLRIAAELHDLVSHGIGVITLRAAAARSVTGAAAAAEHESALADIEQASRGTTAELRRMLTVLRQPGPAPLRPADTLADLPGIIEAANTAGLAATLSVAGDLAVDLAADGAAALGEVSAGAQLAVCAVARETLNNTFRHAGPTAAEVLITRTGPWIEVRVTDDGPRGAWQPEPGAGRGLTNLSERVASGGGELTAGPHGAGFPVTARIHDPSAR